VATMEQTGSGEIVAAWVPTHLADQVKEHAQAERRSVSSVVRHLIEDSFAETSGEGRMRPGGQDILARPPSGAGPKEER